MLGPYSSRQGALADVSAIDFARAPERDADAFCREGYGTLLARLARRPAGPAVDAGEADRLGRRAVGRYAEGHDPRPRRSIVTASTAVLARGAIASIAGLPKSYRRRAVSALSLGQQEQIALEIPGNPFDLDNDDLVFEKASGIAHRGAARQYRRQQLCRWSASAATSPATSRAQGEGAMTDFAIEWLGAHVRLELRRGKVKRSARDALERRSRWSAARFRRRRPAMPTRAVP